MVAVDGLLPGSAAATVWETAVGTGFMTDGPVAGEVVLVSIAAIVFLSTAVGWDAVAVPVAVVNDGPEINGFACSSLVVAIGAEAPESRSR